MTGVIAGLVLCGLKSWCRMIGKGLILILVFNLNVEDEKKETIGNAFCSSNIASMRNL